MNPSNSANALNALRHSSQRRAKSPAFTAEKGVESRRRAPKTVRSWRWRAPDHERVLPERGGESRSGKKIPRSQDRAGSTPASGTNVLFLTVRHFLKLFEFKHFFATLTEMATAFFWLFSLICCNNLHQICTRDCTKWQPTRSAGQDGAYRSDEKVFLSPRLFRLRASNKKSLAAVHRRKKLLT